MRHDIVLVTVLYMIWLRSSKCEEISIGDDKEPLTFVETVYLKLSGACRALIDLQYNDMGPLDAGIKTMKIIQLHGNTIRSFPINEAFTSLTRPAIFDIRKQTKIIIHGYKDNAQSAVPLDLARAYNEKNMFNVLIVDAEQIINKGYLRSIHNARIVGKRLANLLANLENYGANAEDMHLLGISLGAHIAGWAGKYFQQFKSTRIGRITGLDPAGPCFSSAVNDQRLDKEDAMYVDVIHSNRLVQGAIESLGHADFYLNGGGPNQPGCFSSSCSHLRAALVYTESIRAPKSFIGIGCKNWTQFSKDQCTDLNYAVLGYGSSVLTTGTYYLRTGASPPYGLSMEGTKFMPYIDNFVKTFNFT